MHFLENEASCEEILFYNFYLFSNVAKTLVDHLLLFSLQLDKFKYTCHTLTVDIYFIIIIY